MAFVKFTIDGKECMSDEGKYLVEAARENGVYIPTLCNYPGIRPRGSCRICTVAIGVGTFTACTTRVAEGLEVHCATEELEDFRKKVIEILLAEGNHFCPTCEKSGNCELQALAYRYRITVPSFPYMFPKREVEAWHPKLLKDHNRCILCKRCIRGITNADGKALFAFGKRGDQIQINIDQETSKDIDDDLAQKAMDLCPVGAMIRKRKGFDTPIGRRRYDRQPIGSDVEG